MTPNKIVIPLLATLVVMMFMCTTVEQGKQVHENSKAVQQASAEIDTLRTLWGYVPYIGIVDSSGQNVGLLHLRHYTGSTALLSSMTVLVANLGQEGMWYGRVQFDTTATDTTVTLRIYKGDYRR